MSWLLNTPGRIYVVATLLPLAAFALLLFGGMMRSLARPARRSSSAASFVYYLFGGDRPLKAGAYLATGVIFAAAVLAIIGLVSFMLDAGSPDFAPEHWAERTPWASIGPADAAPDRAAVLEIGYRIDQLTALLFAMVTVISTGIFFFSIGYMIDEAAEETEDHEVHVGHGHLKRRGRYGRFFLFLSLFCFSMLNLLIADNLFQVFISWELVGVCSFLLIGFYYERLSASTAANKAFIVNRIGDAGFLVGLAIVWAYFGTFNFQAIQAKLRCPAADTPVSDLTGTIVRITRSSEAGKPAQIQIDSKGKDVLLFPENWHGTLRPNELTTGAGADLPTIPYWLLVVAGLGIFCGCVGKSAQFPLHTWLPDAMEGPTPVSALIHAATMVAAGVYLVGRAYPIFTPEVLLVIAYTGAITLFMAATIALVQTDIKRVLAYSTVSQLGYMMLALGVGGWTAGLFHLLTHAFFKALLFLAAGAVIFGLHHEQDLRKMGGLRKKMPITAFTMLIGVLAIVGTPFFSGWYSKDQIIGQALGFGLSHPAHIILAVLPIVSAALTGFYMFRLWLLAFAGEPRDHHTFEHAHESPRVMSVPLIVLAAFSLGIGWGPEFWMADGSLLGQTLAKAEPATVKLIFAEAVHTAHENHLLAGLLALAAALAGAGTAFAVYGLNRLDPEATRARFAPLHRFLLMKWYFDELYDALFVVPVVKLAFAIGRFDKHSVKPEEAEAADRRVDPTSVDGLLSAMGLLSLALGKWLRGMQSGLLRRYILVLVLTTVVMFAILSFLA